MRRLVAALAATSTAAALFTIASVVRADVFAATSLVSAGALDGTGPVQQVDYAHDATISADGRYVAFDGSYAGVQGVWRKDLQTGVLQPVTSCATPAEVALGQHPSTCDAQLPSLSADGRYVSFTTTTQLDPNEDPNRSPDVYVRDMSVKEGQPSAFTVASAPDGSEAALRYEPSGTPSPVEEAKYGSVAAGRTALSADGRKVVFVTTQISNLMGPGTPVLQVALRDLDTQKTQLVSVRANPASGAPELTGGQPEPVSAAEGDLTYGAVYSPGAVPPTFTTYEQYAYQMPPRIGASISADGTTVAWMGQDVGLQTHTLLEESLNPLYAEPLWRRISEGQSAPIRRVTGGADPDSPACLASGERQLSEPPSAADPCEGPFRVRQPIFGVFFEVGSNSVPQLSANGEEVAFLANAPTFVEGADFGANLESLHTDLFLADMQPSTRSQALTQLTQIAGADNGDIATNGPVLDFALSPDGSQVAFSTPRTTFPLGSPAFVSAPAPLAGLAELFDADISDQTLTRVSTGFAGEAAEHPHEATQPGVDPYKSAADGSLSPMFSASGDTLAFSSTASNLVAGDGNSPPLGTSGKFDGSDAFVVDRITFPRHTPAQEIQASPAPPLLLPLHRLQVTASSRSRSNGSIVLYVQAPEAGHLNASAVAVVRERSRHGRARLRMRRVAVAGRSVGLKGSVELPLSLAPRYRSLAGLPGGLSATVSLTFLAPGRPALRQSLVVDFVRVKLARPHGAKVRRRRTRRRG